MTPQNWQKEHGAEYDVPRVLSEHPRFIDQSWHNDSCPCFMVRECGAEIAIYVEHPEFRLRESENEKRFLVIRCNVDPVDPEQYALDQDPRSVAYTDDIAEAITAALSLADQIKSKL